MQLNSNWSRFPSARRKPGGEEKQKSLGSEMAASLYKITYKDLQYAYFYRFLY